ncbi:MAG: hypothetical protein HYU39_06595 [Thaumarchaeota archaeon]|nr:hypothetical protein [Nitrososphaerota archaeon]
MGGFASLAAFIFASVVITNTITHVSSLLNVLERPSEDTYSQLSTVLQTFDTRIEVTDFAVNLEAANTVSEMRVQIKNSGETSIAYEDFPKIDLVLVYVSRGALGLGAATVVSKRVPFSFDQQELLGGSSAVDWHLLNISNDKVNPISLPTESGAWDRNETITVKIVFHTSSIKAYNDPGSGTFFAFVFALPGGTSTLYNALEPRRFIL